MRVRLAVDIVVDGLEESDEELIKEYGRAKIRDCVVQAVDNALMNGHENGFVHDLDGDLALSVFAIHLVPEPP